MANETLDEKKVETPPPLQASDEKIEETKADEVEEKNEPEHEKEEADNEDSDEEIETPKKKKEPTSAEKKDKDPVTPATDRPTRERKVVERYSAPSTARSNTPKAVSIEKGSGTQLRDIPNVAFKLSKRKPDDNLQMLHTILFGKKAKPHSLKKNIGQFSGFVWAESEQEKQKSKLKEKIDKCVKDKLLDFCDVLNIPVNRAAIKKEELSVKLLEFLESPHVTTDVLLAEKEQKGKKRKVTPSKKATGEASDGKKRKQTPQTKEKQKDVSKTEEEDEETDEKVDSPDNMDEDHDADVAPPKEDSDDEETKSEEEKDDEKKEDETKEQKSTKKSSAEKNVKETKSKEKSATIKKKNATGSSSSKKTSADADEKAKSKTPASKKQKVEKETKEKSVPNKDKASGKKQSTKSPPPVPKNQGKAKKKVKEPTREEMHAVVVSILKEVDFNTATLSDILRQLGTHFGVDLLTRKAEVKEIITEVINNMSDEEEDENEEAEDNADAKDKDGDGEDDA